DPTHPEQDGPATPPADVHDPAAGDETQTWGIENGSWPAPVPTAVEAPPQGESFFEHYARHIAPPRFPNLVDVVIMVILLLFGWLASAALTGTALHFHLFGVMTEKQATTDLHYTLGG